MVTEEEVTTDVEGEGTLTPEDVQSMAELFGVVPGTGEVAVVDTGWVDGGLPEEVPAEDELPGDVPNDANELPADWHREPADS